MQINVFFDRENKEKTIELDVNSSVKDLLSKMNINPVTVIVSKDNNIIMENEDFTWKISNDRILWSHYKRSKGSHFVDRGFG